MLNSVLDFYTFFEDQFNVRLENKLCVLDGIKFKKSMYNHFFSRTD